MKKKRVVTAKNQYPEVLVVEDQVICRKILCAQLASLGYQLDTAEDAQTAICKINKKSYHFIVTDLYLPDQSGRAVIQAARHCELNQGTPLILASTVLSAQDYAEYLALGADVVLSKPYSKKILEEAIYKCAIRPAYRRKFYYQIKGIKKQLTQVLQPENPTQNNEVDLIPYPQSVYEVIEKLLFMIDEYQQWTDLFESHQVSDLGRGTQLRSETMFFGYA